MTYSVAFNPSAATTRYQRNGRDIAVQRFDARRWVAFVGGQCVGTGRTAQEAVAQAANTQATAADVLTQAAAREKAQEAGPPPVEQVTLTPDIRRVFNLPTAEAALGITAEPAAWESLRWAWSDPPVGLRPYQAWALYHIAALCRRYPGKGALIPAPVGQGKTLLGLLLSTVAGAAGARPLILVPAALEAAWKADAKRYRDMGFRLPPTPPILTHETLGGISGATVLDTLNPTMLVIDEADAFANGRSNRTVRLEKWKTTNPNARIFPMCATFLKASLHNLATLAKLTLGELSPLPITYPDLRAVASAVDADARLKRVHPGVLLQHTPPAPTASLVTLARRAVRGALTGRAGYVQVLPGMAADGSTAVPLTFELWRPEAPVEVLRALRDLQATWEHPLSGEVYVYALDMHRAASELSAGFWTRWTPAAPGDWTAARKLVAKALRRAPRAADLPDSAGAWAKALRAGRHARKPLPTQVPVDLGTPDAPQPEDLRVLWARWTAEATRHGTTLALTGPFPGQTREFHRLDPYLVEGAAAWAQEHGPAILWTRSPDFGQWVANHLGCPYYGRGEAGDGIRTEDGTRTVVASVQVHHRGKNLQAFHRNLLLQPYGSAGVLEQNVGRTHRAGQRNPVTFALAVPTVHQERAVAASLRRSRFVAEVEGTEYRLWKHQAELAFDVETLQDAPLLEALETDEP